MTAAAPETPATPGQAPHDLRAEEITREFTGWAEAQGYGDDEMYSFAEMDEAFGAGMEAERALAARQPQPAPGVTVEALAAALDGREIVVTAGNGWERRRARDPYALAGELLGVIDARLTGEPPPALTEHVTVRFPAGMTATAKQLAAAEGMTVSAWMRREIEREATRREQPAPELADAGSPGLSPVEAVRITVAEEWQPRVDAVREQLAGAEREMDLYRNEVTRITAQRDEAREKLAGAEAEAARLRRLLEDQGRGDEAREFLTPAEAALRLRVHPRTLSRLVAAGKLTPDKTPGGHRRYRAAEIEVARLERAGKEAR